MKQWGGGEPAPFNSIRPALEYRLNQRIFFFIHCILKVAGPHNRVGIQCCLEWIKRLFRSVKCHWKERKKKNCWWGRISTDSYVILSLVSCGEVLFNPLDKLHPDFRHVVPPQCVLDKFHIHSHLDLEIEKFTINFKFSPAIMNIRHCFLNISQIHISPVRLGTALIQ